MAVKIQAKVGVFGIGLAAYWPEFDGLKARLEGYQWQIEDRISRIRPRAIDALNGKV